MVHASVGRWILEKGKDLVSRAKVPAGFALFPHDTVHPPRAWAERFFQVERWTPMPRGGHFAAHEEPELLAEELRAFFRPLRASVEPR
jgi:pimeloyl-ACP methyl ester carboxylesterase